MPTSLSRSEIEGIDAYWPAANYLTVGQRLDVHGAVTAGEAG